MRKNRIESYQDRKGLPEDDGESARHALSQTDNLYHTHHSRNRLLATRCYHVLNPKSTPLKRKIQHSGNPAVPNCICPASPAGTEGQGANCKQGHVHDAISSRYYDD
jgi:hypothetical protein